MNTTIPQLQLSNGFKIPKIGFGTWKMGKGREYGPSDNHHGEVAIIRKAVELGMCHVDSAEMYGAGFVEEMIAQALEGIDRSEYMLTSKVAGGNATEDGIKQAIEGTLSRLKVDYLDLYLIHWRVQSIDLEESINAMNSLVDEGLVKHIGVSNFHPDTLAKAQEYSKHPIVNDQVQYNLKHREAEANGLVDYCQNNDTILTAWGPMHPIDDSTSELGLIKEFTQKYNATPGQLALSYLISQKNICTLAKTTSQKHLKENIAAASLVMDQEDLDRIKDQFPDQVMKSPTMPMS